MGDGSPNVSPSNKLESQILETILRRESKGTSIKSINKIILKFLKIDESLRKCKVIFEQFEKRNLSDAHGNVGKLGYYLVIFAFIDEDKSGAIDIKELKRCFEKLHVNFTNEEINDIFQTCDLNDDMGISFNEFIVLLCLVYLLKDDPAAISPKSRMGIPDLEATFEILVESFVFLDSNKDGHVSKNEMIRAIEETKQSEGHIALKRFGLSLYIQSIIYRVNYINGPCDTEYTERGFLCLGYLRRDEMDWDKNGMVNFKEFLFAFTRWVGIDDDEED